MSVKQRIKSILPPAIQRLIPRAYRIWHKTEESIAIALVGRKHKKALKKVRGKEKVKVAFFLIHSSVWKYDLLYKMLQANKRFEPVVIICPYTVHGREAMLAEMEATYKIFQAKGYNVIKAYKDQDQWLDVKKEIQPDIVFFTNPHKLTRDEYYIGNWQDALTCYVPYGFMIANIEQLQYNQLFHNLIWRCFYETKIHKRLAEKYARNKGKNVVVAGYPMCDVFLDKRYRPKNVWKIKDKDVKKIIWAPHHTIETNDIELAYSNFLLIHQFMLDLANDYKDKVQIAFKPHPILKPKLYKHRDWGKEKTDRYYALWQNLTNGQLEEGEYIDLFLTSDAMLFDSISFMSEYIYTGKPSLFLVRDNTIKNKFNDFGRMVFELLYKAHTNEEVIRFVEKTVLNNQDPLYTTRDEFLTKYLTPPNGKTANENIYDYINSKIA